MEYKEEIVMDYSKNVVMTPLMEYGQEVVIDFSNEEARNSLVLEDLYHSEESAIHASKKKERRLDISVRGESVLKQQSTVNQMAQHTGEGLYNCHVCSEVFNGPSQLNHHFLECHSYTCKLCSQVFPSDIRLARHLSKHMHSKCDTCGMELKNKYRLKIHQSVHNKEEYLCEYCGQEYKFSSELELHVQHHLDEKLKCERCGKCFKDQSLLREHKCRLVQCLTCGMEFLNHSSLREHFVYHAGVVSHMKILSHSNSFSHSNIVSPAIEKQRSNLECCGKRFTNFSYFRNHVLSDMCKRSLFKCKTCKNSFKDESLIKAHKCTGAVTPRLSKCSHTTEEKESNFKCKKCRMGYTNNSSSKKHHVSHAIKWKHAFGRCGKRFTSSGRRKRVLLPADK